MHPLLVQPNEVDAGLQNVFVPAWKAALWRSAWLIALPALVSILMVRYLLPPPTASGAVLRFVTKTGNGSPVVFFAVLFVALSSLARYWRHYLPGHGWLVPSGNPPKNRLRKSQFRILELAGTLSNQLSRPRALRQRARVLSVDENAHLQTSLRELDASIAQRETARIEAIGAEIHRVAKKVISVQRRNELFLLVVAIALPAALAGLLRTYVVQVFEITSNSMLPTLETGDQIAASKYAYRSVFRRAGKRAQIPRRGDVIIFDRDIGKGEEHLAKRVIGIPGDRITMDGGVPLINGWRVPHCDVGIYANVGTDLEPSVGRMMVEFLEDRAYLTLYTPFAPAFEFEYQVKENEVFVLGDNRNLSIDSRAWNDGRGAGVPFAKMQGRVEAFLIGTLHGDTADYSRVFHRLNLDPRVHRVDTSEVDRTIKACLRNKPAQTTPPR
jgi:signal peptidase I